jgi:hypothetical protein
MRKFFGVALAVAGAFLFVPAAHRELFNRMAMIVSLQCVAIWAKTDSVIFASISAISVLVMHLKYFGMSIVPTKFASSFSESLNSYSFQPRFLHRISLNHSSFSSASSRTKSSSLSTGFVLSDLRWPTFKRSSTKFALKNYPLSLGSLNKVISTPIFFGAR